MKDFLRKLLSGAIVGIGICLGALAVSGGYAATLSLISGPQPAADLTSIVNTLINNINSSLAPGGTGTMASAFSISGNGAGVVQLIGTGSWTTTTSSCKAAGAGGVPTGTSVCLILLDNTGTTHYIPGY